MVDPHGSSTEAEPKRWPNAAAPRGQEMKRRDFVKTVAMSGMAVAASDIVGDLIAQTPQGKVLESKFKGLSDIALLEAKTQGCTYADIRFTRNTNSGVNASGGNRDFEDFGGGFGGRGGGRGGRGGGRGGGGFGGFGGGGAAGPSGAAGFGVRVIHSGVWGFASSPIVTEDEIRRITRMATEVAKASAIAKRMDVKLAPVPAYTEYWASPFQKDPRKVCAGREAGLRPEDCRRRHQDQGSHQRQCLGAARARVEVLRELGRLVHRAGDLHDDAVVHGHGAEGRPDAVAHVQRHRHDRRLGSRRSGEDARERRAHRRRGGRVLHRQAGRDGRQGSRAHAVARDADDPRDRRPRDRARSHPRLRGQLRRHELRQAVGRRQAEVRLEAVQRHRRPHQAGRHRHGGLSTTMA